MPIDGSELTPLGGKRGILGDACGKCANVFPLKFLGRFVFGIGPIIPNPHPVLAEVANVRFTPNKPDQLVKYALEVKLLGGHHREAFLQVESHLMPKYRNGSRTGAVLFVEALREDAFN